METDNASRAMTHPQENLSSAEFTALVGDELRDYYAARGTRFERLFFFEGQYPFSHETPADAISALYWSLPKPAQTSMSRGLVDLLSTRVELLPPDGLVQLVSAIGLTHRMESLLPMVRVVGQRRESYKELQIVYGMAMSVLVGFGPQELVLQAVRKLSGFRAFPHYLVYEVLELLMRSPDSLWSKAVWELRPRMEDDYRPSEYRRVKERLAFVAQEVATSVSIEDVVDGIDDLLEGDIEGLYAHKLVPRRDPIGMLLAELILEPGAPFKLRTKGSGEIALVSRDDKLRCVIREGTCIRQYFAREQFASNDQHTPWLAMT